MNFKKVISLILLLCVLVTQKTTYSTLSQFNGEFTDSTTLEYSVEAISKIAVVAIDSLVSTIDSIDDNRSILSTTNQDYKTAKIHILRILIKNNTINGFKLEILTNNGVFSPLVDSDNDFGSHGEVDIPYMIEISHVNSNYDANSNINNLEISPQENSQFTISKIEGINSEVNYDANIYIVLAPESLKQFAMAGAYKENLTISYTDNFGPIN